MYFLGPVVAVGETITTFDVPHTSIVTTPVKASRVYEISQTSFDRPHTPRGDSGIKKSISAIDRSFAVVSMAPGHTVAGRDPDSSAL